jgi:glutamyl-tRNA synthetase
MPARWLGSQMTHEIESMRVRFAPSPTGYLHVGGARTALYNWLAARQASQGAFLLRIEDTDRERSTDDAIEQIIDGLEWLQLTWDEGPFRQTEREALYAERLEELLRSGAAYWDVATAADVRQAKEGSGGAGYRGNPVAEGTPGAAVRLRVPDEGETVVEDLIRGTSRFENRLLDDFVIARADRSPLYNFAVAVDDLEMGITHVIRGEDHLSNTPRQLLLLAAMGAERPVYAHLPLLHGLDGKPLSKRHGAVSVQELRIAGFLPEAVRNYLALLGWGHDEKTTFFSTDELIQNFRLDRVSRSPAVFDEQKLRWMNGHYIRELPLPELVERLRGYLELRGLPFASDPRLEEAAAAVQTKIATLAEFVDLTEFAFGPLEIDPKAWEKVMKADGAVDALSRARASLAAVDPFDQEHIEQALRGVVAGIGAKPGAVFQPIRVAVTGKTVSAGVFESLALLGKDESLARIDASLKRL